MADYDFLEYQEISLTETQALSLRKLKYKNLLTHKDKEEILKLQIQLDNILRKLGPSIIRSTRRSPSDIIRKHSYRTKRIFNSLLNEQSIFNLTFDKTLPDRLWINTIFKRMVITNGFDAITHVIQNSDVLLKGLLKCNPKIIVTKVCNFIKFY